MSDKVGGYSGSLPVDKMGPPAKIPSASVNTNPKKCDNCGKCPTCGK